MPTVITIAQQKGGAGKTTLVVQLAVTWAKSGKKVVILDTDPQGSTAAWYLARRTIKGDDDPLDLTVDHITGWRVKTAPDKYKDADIILLDCPPHAETDAKVAIEAGDICVVPVQPSPMDLWASAPTLTSAEKAKVPTLVVMNRVPPRASLPVTILEALKRDDRTIAKAQIGNRVAFASSLMDGAGVAETAARSKAGEEIEALGKEVLAFVKRKQGK